MENKEICIELIRILRKIDPLCGNIKMIVNDGNVDDEYLLSASMLISARGYEGEPELLIELAILTYMADLSVEERTNAIAEAKK